MRLGLGYGFNKRDQLRSGTTNLFDNLNQRTESHLISGSADFGLSNEIRLSLSLPFIINRSVNNSIDQTVSGFGDLTVSGVATLNSRILSKPTNVLAGVGASLPVGQGVANAATDEKNFASGTVDPVVRLTFATGFSPGWTANASFYTRQVIASSGGQKTGDLYVYGFKGTYSPIGGNFSVIAGVTFINRGQDRFNGIRFPNSGGDWIYVNAGVSRNLIGSGESPLRGWAEIQLPLYRYVKGTQLTEKWELRFGLTAGFSISGHEEPAEPAGHFHLPITDD